MIKQVIKIYLSFFIAAVSISILRKYSGVDTMQEIVITVILAPTAFMCVLYAGYLIPSLLFGEKDFTKKR